MTPAVVSHLITLTKGLDKDIKLAAIKALGEGAHPTPAIIQELLLLSQGLDKDVKIAATLSLGRIFRTRTN